MFPVMSFQEDRHGLGAISFLTAHNCYAPKLLECQLVTTTVATVKMDIQD